MCWLEKKIDNNEDFYRAERNKFYNETGVSYTYIWDKLNRGEKIEDEIYKRKWDIENQLLDVKIRDARNGGKFMTTLARVRCANFENANKYWLGENERLCLLCREDLATFEHYIQECEKTIQWTECLSGNRYERFYELVKEKVLNDLVKAITCIEKEINDKLGKTN
ncbi:hypothetical protein TSAR_008376 [Trichomalopsis sarcophagae]|uniref:Uncharacterized protein n=1 Tax=Trichomalopsis sarcophagae TaxID=543379 RepID=A0A232EFX6_9HYME|nr:hypothetical protein TSAR_008376 [Trichomalopsis sarcophagae]